MAEQQVERRIVTVLFADLVGFTGLAERLDAEDVATVQDAYFSSVRETMTRYGGQLEKFIGDAAMAVFGVPRARDDDPARAVRAGLALVHGIEQIGARLGLEQDELRLRVGINTGEVVVALGGPDERRVTGDTVNTAARLQAAAPPSGILVGQATALAVADIAELEPIPPLELKGKAEPTPAQLVLRLRPEPSREQAMGELRAPTLGREAELEALRNAWRRVGAGGKEHWLVLAPPGVGKSRLLREIGGFIGSGTPGRLLSTRARLEATSPLEPIARLLGEALAQAAGGDSEWNAARETLERVLAADGAPPRRVKVVVDAVTGLLWPAAGHDAQPGLEDRNALFAAWLEALDALAAGSAQAWFVEDAHWASGDVLAFLSVARSAPSGDSARGRLVITTARPSLLEAEPAWCAPDPAAGRHVLQLATLAGDDARALVRALVGDALPEALLERVLERSDGNCLFIEELLRTWVSVGTLERGQGEWRLCVAAGEVPLPTSVQSIYAAQLDDLPPAARLLARRASVAGRRFPLSALNPLGIDPADGAEGIDVLSRRALVAGPSSEPPWSDVFSYRHALLRDAGYSSLARAERASLHIGLARWLAETAGANSDEMAASIAGHYAAALDSAPALARDLGGGLDREAVRRLAAEWYERAGRAALAQSAHQAARSLFQRAIDLTDQQETLELGQRWEALASAIAYAADMDEGAAAYEQAIAMYRASIAGDGGEAARRGLARAAAELCDVWYQQIRFDDAHQLADSILRELGQPDPLSLARLLTARVLASQGAGGKQPGMVEDVRKALELARAAGGDEQLELRSLSVLALIQHESGRGDTADWRRLHDVAVRVGSWHTAVSAIQSQAIGLLDERPGDAFALSVEARELALAYGLVEDAGWSDYIDAEAAFAMGDWDHARAAGERAVTLGEANNYRRLVVRTLHVLIPIAEVRGDRQTLARAAAWYAALEGPLPDSPYARLLRPAQGLPLAEAGLAPLAKVEVEPRVASFQSEPSGPTWTAAADRIFRHWIENGELDGASRIVDTLEATIAGMASPPALGRGTLHLLRARLALARDERQRAGEAAAEALSTFRAGGFPWWMAKAIRLLERAGQAPPGLIEEVQAIERKLGAVEPTR